MCPLGLRLLAGSLEIDRVMAEFRILSLEGGGIRGAFGAAYLTEIEQRLGQSVTEHFDLIAGTSTGAITAASLANGMQAQAVVDFYRKHVGNIFHPREPHQPKGLLRLAFPAARRMMRNRTSSNFDDFFRSRYCPHALSHSFEDAFGDTTLGELSRGPLVVPSVNLTQGHTHVFRTPHLTEFEGERDLRVRDVLRAATAAPTYFPHKVMPDGDAYCDGGLWANNPGVLAVAEAIKIRRGCVGDRCDLATDVSKIYLLSIGTGLSTYSLSPPGSDAGILYWARYVADVMGFSQAQGTEIPLDYLLGDRYQMVNFEIPDASWTLDAIEHMERLFKLGRDQAAANFEDVAEKFFSNAKR